MRAFTLHRPGRASVLAGAGTILLVLTLLGCVERDVAHVVYLKPDGSLTWTILEREARSNADDPAERQREETDFLLSRQVGSNHLATALTQLGAHRVRTVRLRDERPFAIWTEGTFRSATELIDCLLTELDLTGSSRLELAPAEGRLDIRIDLPDPEADIGPELTPEIEELLLLDTFAIRLTEGRFLEAVGFELSEDGTEAVPFDLAGELEQETLASDDAAGDEESSEGDAGQPQRPADAVEYRLVWERPAV